MRETNTCPKCKGRRIWRIDEVHTETDTLGGKPLRPVIERELPPGPNQKRGWLTTRHTSVGVMDLYICAACGFAEWYARQLEGLVHSVSNEGMCTSACCSSGDCPGGFVCYAPGTGGRYCVDPLKLGRGTLGTETAGTLESVGSRCRSGAVVSGRCADTCCSDTDCTAGSACAFGSMNGHDGLFCAAGTGAGMQWATCSSGSDCHDSACVNFGFSLGNRCIQECCGSSGCGTIGALPARCYFESSSNGDYMPLCAEATVGTRTIGVACTSNSDCISGVCYNDVLKGQMYCTDSCCQDLHLSPRFQSDRNPDRA